MTNHSIIEKRLLEALPAELVKFSEPIKQYTYTKLGGEADIFVTPKDANQLQTVLQLAKQYETPVTLIGNGSNLIVKDEGIQGITINLNKMDSIKTDGQTIYAQAGAKIIDVSRHALESRLSGLEFACGIPGTVGGALYMNAGAYGGQISDVLKSATVMTEEGELLNLKSEDLELSYRKSIISEKKYIVLEAEFILQPAEYEAIKEVMDKNTFLRESKQPLEYPSCGSVFKRPQGHYTGKLVQDCGLQGYRIGGAEVSTKHAGFIVNVDNATAKDYIDLIHHVQKTVKERYSVDLEREVVIIGRDSKEK
ncbi:UDP-N-acetylmuramate dehydrogenase [Metabacillus malikii]|uniref:UDP-N-acetylenolpyruvoylglucosamine reductase n=1 Tax=Metabacillus malikii TaxID=1504265 RepID=A0ABT9ZMS2_9BACI|nr:UDP-N-acetylmuramate dehydrogenase [Metabacillus malikii]MDQ0233549.1 UDP-N-acetylmuramate dehydrogenase [Metabacillus malikii]